MNATGLYKVSTIHTSVWNKYPAKPFYVIASSKEDAHSMVETMLRNGYSVSKVSLLGNRLSQVVYCK